MYRPLKSYIESKGDSRLRLHSALRDRIVDAIVCEWPVGCPVDRIEEVLAARMMVRLRAQYGSVSAKLMMAVTVGHVIKLTCDWWYAKRSHRELMDGWTR